MVDRPTLITCKVIDPDGQPVEFARAFFTGAPVPTPDVAALSDAEGRVVLTAPSPGTYRVGVAAEGLEAHELELEITGEEDIEQVFRLEADAD